MILIFRPDEQRHDAVDYTVSQARLAVNDCSKDRSRIYFTSLTVRNVQGKPLASYPGPHAEPGYEARKPLAHAAVTEVRCSWGGTSDARPSYFTLQKQIGELQLNRGVESGSST